MGRGEFRRAPILPSESRRTLAPGDGWAYALGRCPGAAQLLPGDEPTLSADEADPQADRSRPGIWQDLSTCATMSTN